MPSQGIHSNMRDFSDDRMRPGLDSHSPASASSRTRPISIRLWRRGAVAADRRRVCRHDDGDRHSTIPATCWRPARRGGARDESCRRRRRNCTVCRSRRAAVRGQPATNSANRLLQGSPRHDALLPRLMGSAPGRRVAVQMPRNHEIAIASPDANGGRGPALAQPGAAEVRAIRAGATEARAYPPDCSAEEDVRLEIGRTTYMYCRSGAGPGRRRTPRHRPQALDTLDRIAGERDGCSPPYTGAHAPPIRRSPTHHAVFHCSHRQSPRATRRGVGSPNAPTGTRSKKSHCDATRKTRRARPRNFTIDIGRCDGRPAGDRRCARWALLPTGHMTEAGPAAMLVDSRWLHRSGQATPTGRLHRETAERLRRLIGKRRRCRRSP